jgi:hypothetical protein
LQASGTGASQQVVKLNSAQAMLHCDRPAPIRLRLRLHVESQAPREKKPIVKVDLPLQSGIRLGSSMDEIR